jgi:hypothetical protein
MALLYNSGRGSFFILVLHNRCKGLLSVGFLLLHNNACPHSVAATVEAIRQLKFELLPPIHMFGPLKEASHVRRFASGDDVKDAMHK